MNQIAHKFMAELKVYKDMANEEDYNERGIKTRSIANNGNGHDNSDSNDSDIRMMNVFLLAAFGWTPDLLKYMRGTSRSTFGFFLFFILFFVDLADAVFDLILSVQTIMLGSEGAGTGLGLLLFITTVLGRIVSGLYGWHVAKHPPDEYEAFFTFAMMEMGVFFLEDGAAILVLAKSTGGMTVVETISMWLTMICGVCYIGYFVFSLGKVMLEDWQYGYWESLLYTVLPAVGSVVFQSYIFITEVILSKDDDAPLSGVLEIAAFAVYGVSALFIGGVTAFTFSGSESIF